MVTTLGEAYGSLERMVTTLMEACGSLSNGASTSSKLTKASRAVRAHAGGWPKPFGRCGHLVEAYASLERVSSALLELTAASGV